MTLKTFTIQNNQGDSIAIANYGARLINWYTQVSGSKRNIILGYKNIDDYLADPFFMGALVGPYANRIANSECKIDNSVIKLKPNEGKNQLHGGDNALANQFWRCVHHNISSVTLSCTLIDGFNGYPGKITVTIEYSISDGSELKTRIAVHTGKATVAGPTTHPYFNLNSELNSNKHSLQVNCQHYTPTDNESIPLGDIVPVTDSQFDFLQNKVIDRCISLDDNYVSSLTDTTNNKTLYKQAILTSDIGDVELHVSSNYPALQVYTGQHLQRPFEPYQGVCLEPQFCPDSPNNLKFPFHLTTPNKPLSTVIIYALQKKY